MLPIMRRKIAALSRQRLPEPEAVRPRPARPPEPVAAPEPAEPAPAQGESKVEERDVSPELTDAFPALRARKK